MVVDEVNHDDTWRWPKGGGQRQCSCHAKGFMEFQTWLGMGWASVTGGEGEGLPGCEVVEARWWRTIVVQTKSCGNEKQERKKKG